MYDSYVWLGRELAKLMEERAAWMELSPAEGLRRSYERMRDIRRGLVARGTPTADFRFLGVRLGAAKRALGGDAWEYNDDAPEWATSIRLRQRLEASIGPDPDDVDVYVLAAAPPRHAHEAARDPTSEPLTLILGVGRTGAANLDVTVHRLGNEGLVEVDRFEVRGAEPVVRSIPLPEPCYAFVTVRAADPAAAAGPDRTYVLEAARVQHR